MARTTAFRLSALPGTTGLYTLRPITDELLRITSRPSGKVLFEGKWGKAEPISLDIEKGQTPLVQVLPEPAE